jgi:hypothetical protein
MSEFAPMTGIKQAMPAWVRPGSFNTSGCD